MVRNARWLASVAALIGVLTAAADVRAGEAEARALFEEGLALVDAGRLDDARSRFERSHAEKHSVGALLNLGDIEEKLHNLPRAHVRFREAGDLAASIDPNRVPEANRRANDLRPKLAVLSFVGSEPSPAFTVDGAPAAALGNDVVLAPGHHTVRIEAGGRMRELTVDVRAGESRKELLFPSAPPGPPNAPPEPPGSLQPTVGWVTVGVGGAAVVVGVVLGVLAIGKKSDLSALCAGYPACAPNLRDQATSLDDSGRALATGSTVAFIVGGVAVAGGVVLLATSPAKQTAGTLRLTARPTALQLEGSF